MQYRRWLLNYTNICVGNNSQFIWQNEEISITKKRNFLPWRYFKIFVTIIFRNIIATQFLQDISTSSFLYYIGILARPNAYLILNIHQILTRHITSSEDKLLCRIEPWENHFLYLHFVVISSIVNIFSFHTLANRIKWIYFDVKSNKKRNNVLSLLNPCKKTLS